MTQITLSTLIQAPLETVFDLARDAAFRVETASQSGERIVAGRASGLFELGDEVVFEGRHLGVRQKLGTRIVAMEPPRFFADEMTRGVFKSLRHEHHFETLTDGQIRMTDIVTWRSPLGILGIFADLVAVRPHLRSFLRSRGRQIKAKAEGPI